VLPVFMAFFGLCFSFLTLLFVWWGHATCCCSNSLNLQSSYHGNFFSPPYPTPPQSVSALYTLPLSLILPAPPHLSFSSTTYMISIIHKHTHTHTQLDSKSLYILPKSSSTLEGSSLSIYKSFLSFCVCLAGCIHIPKYPIPDSSKSLSRGEGSLRILRDFS
jgi:hypothetical protein